MIKYFEESHADRRREYKTNKKLYEGELFEVFGIADYPYFKEYKPTNTKLAFTSRNWFKSIVDIYANFLNDPTIEFANEQNQVWFDEFKARNKFNLIFTDLVKANLFFGNMITSLQTDKNNLSKVKIISPKCWVPEIDEEEAYEEPEKHYIYSTKEVLENQNKVEYVLEKAFGVGFILYKIYKKNDIINKEKENWLEVDLSTYAYIFPELAGLSLTQTSDGWALQTGLDFNLITIFKNENLPGEYFGKSEFSESLKSLVFAYCFNLVRIEEVLNSNTNPLLVVPEVVIDNVARENQGKTEEQSQGLLATIDSFNSSTTLYTALQKQRIRSQIREKAQVMGISSKDDVVPGYVEQDGTMITRAHEHIKIVAENILLEANIAQVLTNPELATATSGVGVKRLMQLTINKVMDKALHYKYGLQELIYKAMLVDQLNGQSVTPEYPEVKIDILIDKEKMEILQELELMDTLGTVTELDKVEIAREMPTDQAKTTLEQIKTESKERDQAMAEQFPSLNANPNLS